MVCSYRHAIAAALSLQLAAEIRGFAPQWRTRPQLLATTRTTTTTLFSDWDDNSQDTNQWSSNVEDDVDWEDVLARKKDGSFWSEFTPSDEDTAVLDVEEDEAPEVDESEVWLDTLASLQAEEVSFNMKEAERADKVRQMQEWGFEASTIESTLDVSIQEMDEVDGMKAYRDESYWEDEDLKLVESHQKVPKDPITGEPERSQMVYVDEHTCIGCTNCAMIAQSTFFMQEEHGRARVFQQWGDDDETIQIAIETCPVDCIHYIPYDELEKLEVERRDQNINFKARLVSQAEYGGAGRVSGSVAFTAPQEISGNKLSRCNNCPSRGCKDCPMYGVGKNPEYEKKEEARKARMAKARLDRERDRDNKSADL